MFAAESVSHTDAGGECDAFGHEDIEAPVNWALDDFADILPDRQQTGEWLPRARAGFIGWLQC